MKKPVRDFEFIVNDDHTYYQTTDFRSPQAKALFDQYRQLDQSFRQQREQLDKARQAYAAAEKIHLEKQHKRTEIGLRALKAIAEQ